MARNSIAELIWLQHRFPGVWFLYMLASKLTVSVQECISRSKIVDFHFVCTGIPGLWL